MKGNELGNGIAFDCSNRLFPGRNLGNWYQVTNFLYMYIPLLTMGVITKELSSGSIKLLYSSPIVKLTDHFG